MQSVIRVETELGKGAVSEQWHNQKKEAKYTRMQLSLEQNRAKAAGKGAHILDQEQLAYLTK